MDVEWLSALAGATGVTGASIAGHVWRKTAAKRARLGRTPLKIEVSRDDSEPGQIWEVATDEILEREAFLDVYSLDSNGLIEPNRLLREAQQRWNVYDVGQTSLSLEIYNPSAVPVWIVAISAEVVERRGAPRGTRISNPPQGEAGVLELRLDLANGDGRVRDAGGKDYFARTKREIAPGGREFLDLTASCSEGAVRWRLRLDLLVGSQKSVQRVPASKNRPWMTSAYQPREAYQRSWVCSPLAMACDDAGDPPHLHDERLDTV